jgi:hypothetical protein
VPLPQQQIATGALGTQQQQNPLGPLQPGQPPPSQSATPAAAVSARDKQQAAVSRVRNLTLAGNGILVPVTLSASSTTVTFIQPEQNDILYGVAVVPSWNTTCYVGAADKTLTGFTVHYGTNAPASGSPTIDYHTYRTEAYPTLQGAAPGGYTPALTSISLTP